MYKFLLCWKYLRTRYIALASIISVMLGVATMIVVNAVMAGFTTEMQNRIHGILSDVVFESLTLDGFPDPDWHMQRIREIAGDQIEGMTATVAVPAMLTYQVGSQWINRQVMLIGIDETTHARVSAFSQYLQHPANREQLSFALREAGYDEFDHQSGPDAPRRHGLDRAGWQHRRTWAERDRLRRELMQHAPTTVPPPDAGSDAAAADPFAGAHDPFAGAQQPAPVFDPAQQTHTGVVIGIALASSRDHRGVDHFALLPGDDVKIAFPGANPDPSRPAPPNIVAMDATIVDFYESKMSEYDSNFVFVPLRTLQERRVMFDSVTGARCATAIQIKLREGADLDLVRNKLRAAFPPQYFGIYTWRDKQGPLLAAVEMEKAVLNILLFMIIAVAGFGILATFFMIVVEKTRDIGILKSLGASAGGILGIFLGYGLSLGVVGSGVGMVMGLLFVRYINQVRAALESITGTPVFDPSIYYFYTIPTIVEPFTVAWIVCGALLIAVLASVLPALRAALLHPVEALRYE